jgi:hypothetical protein
MLEALDNQFFILKNMSDKLSIQNEMMCFDRKDRAFYSSLTDEERKKFSNFLMIRWGSSVQGTAELQHYYLQSSNHYVNKHFFAINRHPKLQWLCATAVSPDLGTQRHQWIAPKKKEAGASGVRKQIAELFPHLKDDEIELMSKINTKKDIDTYVKQLGQEVKK